MDVFSFEEVFNDDPSDLVWMYVNVARDWDDLDHTLTYWLKKKEFYWKQAQEQVSNLSWFDR